MSDTLSPGFNSVQHHRGYALRWSADMSRWNIENARGMPVGWSLTLTGARNKVDRLYESSVPLAVLVAVDAP